MFLAPGMSSAVALWRFFSYDVFNDKISGRNSMKAAGTVLLALFTLFLFDVAVSEASCIRCVSGGLDMVCDGESKFVLIDKCGQPDFSEEVAEETRGSLWKGDVNIITEKVELLYYNCGDGAFIKVIRIKGGRIVSMKDADRGYGRGKCQ